MKFNVAKKNVQTAGGISTKAITLSANAKAFKLVFGQIYPDIIKAIVRELFTNAWDSQKSAGTLDQPINIHLPSTYEPYFSIRDFGTGMTPEVIEDIYSRIFESTKDGSDDEAGMFGMGSKTPLGYTDSFSVTSYIDGIFWYYSIYMNEDGAPVISLQATGETDEPNGVEVQLSVERDDFDSFRSNAEHFALGANTPININQEKFLTKRKIFQEGDNWQLYSDEDYSGSMIRMGCVLYKIDTGYLLNSLRYSDSDYYKKRDLASRFNKPFVFDFDIGEFEVTASREDIIYNKESIEKLFARCGEAYDIISERARGDIQNSKTYIEALEKRSAYTRNGFEVEGAKYKSMKLHNVISTDCAKYNFFAFDVLSNKNVMKRESSRDYSIRPLRLNEVSVNFVLYRIPGEKITRSRDRIQNFAKTLDLSMARQNMYSRNKNTYAVHHIHIEESLDEVRRLFVFLPKNTIFVNIADLVLPEKKKVVKVSGDEYIKTLHKTYYDEVEVSTYHKILKDKSYYVNVKRKDFVDDYSEIKAAMLYFKDKINYNDVYCIGVSQQHLVKEFELVNLLDEFKKVRDSLTYNEDTLNKHALGEVKSKHVLSHILESEEGIDFVFAGLDINQDNIEANFNRNMNQGTIDAMDKKVAEMTAKLDKFGEEYPIFKFIDRYETRSCFNEIMEAIKEMKK